MTTRREFLQLSGGALALSALVGCQQQGATTVTSVKGGAGNDTITSAAQRCS
jgi:hypothetical protein